MKRTSSAYSSVLVLIILAVSTFFPALVQAVDYAPGVKAGDWIKYGQIKLTWTGNGTLPPYAVEDEKVDWLRMDILTVSGTFATVNETVHFNNGTRTSANSTVDVTGNEDMNIAFLVACNLTKGDHLTAQTGSPMINQTTTGRYAGSSRNINLIEQTTVINNQTATNEVYWDQTTGVMVETYKKAPDSFNSNLTMEMSVKATETNMWSPDLIGIITNDLLYIITAIVIIIVVIAATLMLRRNKPPAPPAPPLTPPLQTSEALMSARLWYSARSEGRAWAISF